MAIKKTIIAVLITASIFYAPVFAHAQGAQEAKEKKYGLWDTARGTKLPALAISDSTPEGVAGLVVQSVLGLIGIAFFLLMLYAGIIWMTAMGSAEKVTKAKTMMETAIIGIIIVSASYAVATFVFTKLTAAPISETATSTATE
jgi:archaellum component FlaF (FlaF/FlaG flagellin family)